MDRRANLRLGMVVAMVAALVVCLAGCSGANRVATTEPPSAAQVISNPQPEVARVDQAPGVPDVASLPRGTSTTGLERFQYGADFLAAAPAGPVEMVGTAVEYTPNWDGSGTPGHADLAWSVYRFNLVGYTDGGPLHLQWGAGAAPQVGQDWYLGFSNFEREAWLWQAGTGSIEIELPDLSVITRDGGELFVALVVLGEAPCRLDWLRIGGNLAPTPALDVAIPAGKAPLATGFDASGSSDLDGSIVNYEWDLDGNLVFNEPGPEQDAQGLAAVEYTYAATGSYHPTVLITDDAGDSRSATTLVEVSSTASLATHTWGGPEPDTIYAITHDAAGNTYMAGSTWSFGSGSEDLLLLKYNPQGELLWVRNWGGNSVDAGLGITVREPDLLHIVGYTDIPDGNDVALLLEYRTDGTFLNSMVWGSC